MLSAWRRLVLCAAALLAACDTGPQPLEPPLDIEASYRLTFNGLLVGHALFALHVGADGRYRIEAFTVPAGQMEEVATHEVLERSEGLLGADAIRPQRFDHSVIEGERIEVRQLKFDWDRHALQLRGGDRDHDVGLLPGTHDRLSYLLAARRLAARGEGMVQIRIAAPEASGEARLQVTGRDAIEVPLGHFQAVAVGRTGPQADETRVLWFDPGFAPLPLRIVHLRDGSTVEMQLEGINRSPSGPR